MGNAHRRSGRRAWAMLPEAVPLASWRTQLPACCDGMDCSQGFCLLNNAAIAAPPALLRP
jgi:hypothetical protein